jgi:Domain of unknown function (DUF4157)
MMQQAALQAKADPQGASASRQEGAAEAKGAALAPPAYGVDFVDRAATGGEGLPAKLAAPATAPASPGLLERVPLHADRVRPSGHGRPLDGTVRRKMEGAFGADFSSVRVHEDEKASALGAHAFTLGDRLHFARGKYRPGSLEGQRLIGHELTHVVQQRGGRVGAPVGGLVEMNRNGALEREADTQGANASLGRPVTVQGVSSGVQGKAVVGGGGVIQCQGDEDADKPRQEYAISKPIAPGLGRVLENLGKAGGRRGPFFLLNLIGRALQLPGYRSPRKPVSDQDKT